MKDDAELLHQYAEEGSEAAFTELVQRHVDLVYGAALRRTGNDSHRANDVAQQVFTTLARNARKLVRHDVLSAWLHTATRNAALNLMISEQRRKVRESEALALESGGATRSENPDWTHLRPVLDAVIDELPEADRAAVVLRFLERRPFAEVGSALRISEDAARMRSARALEKLRAALARRGITSTAAALGVIVTSQPLISAPAGLAASLAAQSLAAAGTGAAVTLFSIMTAKLITTAAISGLIAFGLGSYTAHTPDPITPTAPAPGDTSQASLIASLRQDNQVLATQIARLNSDLDQLRAVAVDPVAQTPARTTAAATPVMKSPTLGLPLAELQQGVLNNLRQIDAARKQYLLEKGRAAGSIHDLVGSGAYIRTVRTVGGEDYAELSMQDGALLTVSTPDGVSITYDPTGVQTTPIQKSPEVLRVEAMAARIQPSVMKALEAYRAANNGANPPNEQAVLPFFSTAAEGADFVELIEAQKAARGR